MRSSLGGCRKRPDPVTTVLHPVSGRVVCSSRSGDLIHRSRQAGWGLACGSTNRLSRRPASPIRTRRMGSGQSCGRTVATNLQVCRNRCHKQCGFIRVLCLAGWKPTPRTGNPVRPHPDPLPRPRGFCSPDVVSRERGFRADRGRESRMVTAPPPSKPDWRISRIRLSGR